MQIANRIATWVLLGSVLFFVGKQEIALQDARWRVVEAESNLIQVRHFLALERAHVKKLCALEKEAK